MIPTIIRIIVEMIWMLSTQIRLDQIRSVYRYFTPSGQSNIGQSHSCSVKMDLNRSQSLDGIVSITILGSAVR